MTASTYIIAFYEVDRLYGGPEEGGWWYDVGDLVRIWRVTKSEAEELARRANRLLDHIQRSHPPLSSVSYEGGRYAACVFPDTAPTHFPDTRPHYE